MFRDGPILTRWQATHPAARWCAALGALFTIAGLSARPAAAQVLGVFEPPRTELSAMVTVEEAEQATRAHLERVQQFLAARQWSEAVQTLRQVMESDSERLLAVADTADTPFVRYVRVRHYCHALLCEWKSTAPEALALYRQEVDAIAERWLSAATEQRDEELLARIAEQFFASSSGDQALLLLGEFALERGDYTQARSCWEALSPALRSRRNAAEGAEEAASRGTWLAYPDTDIPLAELRARLVLVSLLEGSPERAALELARLKERHPTERGTIGGREGLYTELLGEWAEQSASWPPLAESPTHTFAGSPQRGGEILETLDVGGAPLWRVPLTPVPADRELLGRQQLRVGEDQSFALSHFPVIVEGTVYVADAHTIRAWDLETGAPQFGASANTTIAGGDSAAGASRSAAAVDPASSVIFQYTPRGPQHADTAAHLGVPRYTLTAERSRLFAKLGSPVTRWPDLDDVVALERAQIIGLDLTAQGRLLPGFPLTLESADWSFDGAPLCDGQRLFLPLRRQDDVRVEAHVACHDAISGRLLWRRQICAAETPGQGSLREITHNLLTLAGSTLYFNTNLGAVAALDTGTGRMRWLTRYPRALFPAREPDDSTVHFFRDLNPALFDRGQLFIAPADCDRLFALDAISGQVLWSTPAGVAADIRHLLGTTADHLLASGEYLYWLDRFTGRVVTQFPEPRSQAPGRAAASPRGYGRGLLGQREVYWPTREAIHVFDLQPQTTPWGAAPVPRRAPLPLAPFGITSGNLVAGQGVLLIAGPTELVALRNW